MNFKKGNFVSPSNGFKQGKFVDPIISKTSQGSINPAPSQLTQFFRQVKNNPSAPYSFIRAIGLGASFAPIANIGKIGAAGLNLFKSKVGVSAAKTIGSKLPSPSSTQIINNRVNQNIQNLTSNVKPLTTRERVTGMSEDFFKKVEISLGDKARFAGGRNVEPFITGTNRIKDPFKMFK